jgi:mannose-6-phosphate isomerase-like protein (cupin superfamily)
MSDSALASVAQSMTEAYQREGFLGPINLLTPAQCALLLRHWRRGALPAAPVWAKGRAANDRVFYDLATHPALLPLLRDLLGEDVVLWGATIIERDPGQIHPWHTDIESSNAKRSASIWVGLENTSRESALQLISRSHAFGDPIQHVMREAGLRRGQASDETVLEWARRRDPHAALVQPEMTDGQAIMFDGRLWHATNNTRSNGRRAALLLQYAAAHTPIFVPDLTQLEWPFRLRDDVRPPCIVVSGSGKPEVNRLVAPPAAARSNTRPLSTCIKPVSLPLARDPTRGWRPHPLFHGSTPVLDCMASHVSVLDPGHSPHPPHAHLDEELLIVLGGEAEIVIADGPHADGARIETLSSGSLVYYPAYQFHTIRNGSAQPVTYLMLKWYSQTVPSQHSFETRVEHVANTTDNPRLTPFKAKRLFEFPTSFLTKLHAHQSLLQPKAGYLPHTDDYDLAILLLSGRVEIAGQVVGPFGIIYHAAGEPHGIKNIGGEPARYLVFEFHAPGRVPRNALQDRRATSDLVIISDLADRPNSPPAS